MPSKNLIAIVDYGLGNLFSIKNACEFVGLKAVISSAPEDFKKASAVILPGVGAFGEAMGQLNKRGLVGPLRDLAAAGKPMIGICLGMQLMMSESLEFGCHEGLGIIPGKVLPLKDKLIDTHLKVPHIGWNRIIRVEESRPGADWEDSLLRDTPPNTAMYFVHSYYCEPAAEEVVLSTTRYGGFSFCSSLRSGNAQAFQFHPERSGAEGLKLYKNLAQLVVSANCR